MNRSVVIFIVGCLYACGGTGQRTKSATPTTSALSTEQSETPKSAIAKDTLLGGEFGDSLWGFSEGSSENGRFVFLRRFPGADKPEFGHHGEAMGASPVLSVFDRFTGVEREIDELIDAAGRRWFLVIDAETLFLLDADTGEWENLDDVDMTRDGNQCMSPRHASFSKSGKRAAWISSDAGQLVVREVESNVEWTVPSSASIWRGWPRDEDKGAILVEVPNNSAWPQQNTSCACRWCGRFALSSGMYGWGGPEFSIVHAKADGSFEPWKDDPPTHSESARGKTDAGCTLTASKGEGKDPEALLSKGPWQWICPATP